MLSAPHIPHLLAAKNQIWRFGKDALPKDSKQAAGLQDNVALIAVLEALDPPSTDASNPSRRQLICVANTHIHANPELNDVKLWQVSECCARCLRWLKICFMSFSYIESTLVF